MKILIVYYSQTGNTQKIARQIRDGMREAGHEVDLRPLWDAAPGDLAGYELVGFGSPVWYEMPPNMRRFVESLPDQGGRLAFSFCTHATMPDLYFPLVVPRLAGRGMRVAAWRKWYGNASIQIFPEPYYTAGHPDAQDLDEARSWGAEVAERAARVLAGETGLLPPWPAPDFTPMHALAAIDHLGGSHNVHGRLARDPDKCLYPKCHICMDNCTMGYIDLSAEPQRYGSCGDACDDCHGCTYCEMLCPTGAIHPVIPYEQAAPVGVEHRSELFETVLGMAEAAGEFRRLIPQEEVGSRTPFYSVHDRHPRLKPLRFDGDK